MASAQVETNWKTSSSEGNSKSSKNRPPMPLYSSKTFFQEIVGLHNVEKTKSQLVFEFKTCIIYYWL